MENSFNVSAFRNELAQDGFRPNLFRITINFPVQLPLGGVSKADVSRSISMMAKASSIPASIIGEIAMPFMGRQTFHAGDRTYEPWNVTIIADEDFSLRNVFEAWHNSLDTYNADRNRKRTYGLDGDQVNQYIATATVSLIGKRNNIVKTYDMVNCWPTNVGAMELAWDDNDKIGEFDVTFRFDAFEPSDLPN